MSGPSAGYDPSGKSGRNVSVLPTTVLDWIVAGALFLLAFGLALYDGWSKAELFWAVWIVSLAVAALLVTTAYIYIAVALLRHAASARPPPSEWVLGTGLYLFVLAATVVPLGAIYMFTGRFVASAILNEPAAGIDAALISDLLRAYWPIVLASVAARGLDAAAMLRAAGGGEDSRGDQVVRMIRTALFGSAGFFLATFVFVFAVAFAEALALDPGWWLYTLVFAAFYIFPTRPLPGDDPDRTGADGEPASVLDEKVHAELAALFSEPELTVAGRRYRYPDFRSLYASPEFSRFAELLRFSGQETRLKSIEAFLTQRVVAERADRRRQ